MVGPLQLLVVSYEQTKWANMVKMQLVLYKLSGVDL